ncbi:MAG: serine hydrolase domain-containing protein [Planctomycetota bacterium]|jgi:CubicO group peptidase (beta-lactamase class C family)
MTLSLAALALLAVSQEPPAVLAALSQDGPLLAGYDNALTLSAPSLPGRPWFAAASLSALPGIPTAAGLIALVPDPLFVDTLGAAGFAGLLDAEGAATVTLQVPDDPALEGLEICTAAIVLGIDGIQAISNTLPRRIRGLTPVYDFTEVDAVLQEFSDGWFLNDGIAFAFVQNGQLRHVSTFGDIELDTRVPWASASKWFSAAGFETLVDRGLVTIDDVLSDALPPFARDKAEITYRQAWSHTSGLPGNWPCMIDTTSTLQACAQSIATAPLDPGPRTVFDYGGASMQAVGAAIESLVGKPYEVWFQESFAGPLGATTFAYDGSGPTLNPQLGGAGKGTVLDYVPMLEMLLDGGAVDGRPVLSSRAIGEIMSEQTGLETLGTASLGGVGYGLGCWVNELGADGRPSILSSPGLFGAYPWIDLDRGYGAFVLIQRTTVDGKAIVEAIRKSVEEQAEKG